MRTLPDQNNDPILTSMSFADIHYYKHSTGVYLAGILQWWDNAHRAKNSL